MTGVQTCALPILGKPFQLELDELQNTYTWANNYDISSLVEFIEHGLSFPMVAIGSGGSITAAEFLCELHSKKNGLLAKPMTPLEAINYLPNNKQLSVWLLSAGGNNPDILYTYNKVVTEEPKQVVVMCGDQGSKLIKNTTRNGYVDVFAFSLPSGKDGFLATNSLFAFLVLLSRCYRSDSSSIFKYPPTFKKMWRSVFPKDITLSNLNRECKKLWEKKTIIVLYSTILKSVAIDIESKFTEAALGNIQIADFRNFAHGRHHWLAKYGDDTGLIVFTSPSDAKLAASTLSLLPTNIPNIHVPLFSDESEALVGLLALSFHLVGWAGQAKNIDPGMPGVPAFGVELYRLKLPRNYTKQQTDDETIIFRKSGMKASKMCDHGSYDFWKSALATFRRRLANARFSGIVFDYDGTLIDSHHRFDPPSKIIADELIRFLTSGLPIGIATGRGKSVRKDLQSIIPKKYWGSVLIGYYNGAEIATLDNNKVPAKKQLPGKELATFRSILSNDPEVSLFAEIDARRSQLTIMQKSSLPENRLWDITNQHLMKLADTQLVALRSSHSIDVLSHGVSKLKLLTVFRETYNLSKLSILTVGDRGKWPGNDYELLAEPYSLSVDEVSADPVTCWNLSEPGVQGVQATYLYCQHLLPVSKKGLIKFQYKKPRKMV